MEGYLPIPMFNEGLLLGKRPFQDWAMPWKKCLKNAREKNFFPTSSKDPLFSN